MKLQEYLNNLENKQEIKEINLTKIQQERQSAEQRDESELLEGGELNLQEFTNLEKVEIDPKLLKTPLTKLNVDGLTHLKELDWLESKEDTPEEKKLWTELGIEGDEEKKEVVKEVNRLAQLKGIKVNFSGEEKEGTISLSLDSKDNNGNFAPSLVFWTLAWNYVKNSGGTTENPSFWTQLDKELEWIKQNLSNEYFQELEELTTPSLFPREKLGMNELLSVYYPNSEDILEAQTKRVVVAEEVIDKTWQTLKEKILELVNQELEKKPEEEELKKLAIKLTIHYNVGYDGNDFTIKAHYNSEIPFKPQLEQLITNTPLQLEIQALKEEKEQLPTAENFAKLTKQAKVLENYLQDLMSEEEYEKVKQEISKIN